MIVNSQLNRDNLARCYIIYNVIIACCCIDIFIMGIRSFPFFAAQRICCVVKSYVHEKYNILLIYLYSYISSGSKTLIRNMIKNTLRMMSASVIFLIILETCSFVLHYGQNWSSCINNTTHA